MNLELEITDVASVLDATTTEAPAESGGEMGDAEVTVDEIVDTFEVKRIIEGLIMAANEPLSLEYLHKLLTTNNVSIEKKCLREVVEALRQEYAERNCAIELKEVASGYRFQVGNDLASWISKLWEEKPPRYSRAYLETLSIIIYKQPVTRAEIEEIRGVSVSSNIMKTLLDHGWIKIVGHKEVPGRPALYVTTAKFLDYFNLKNLEDLPALAAAEIMSSVNIDVSTNVEDQNKETITDLQQEQEL